ncbi:FAD-binding protein [Halobacterium salinarum]|uniref:UDP-N-acetylmuramate dehydrogenase n=1 Tax=Halobacterium salinarum TaxID=2242 RepID=UPI002555CA7A|nr:FAD-binding protein [Halobacterium salinarum]MDL0126362.1 FAD-binding protein [Halobacterium salinarum]
MKTETERLAEHTWLKIGGPAEIATPESRSEFVDLLTECHERGRKYRILGGGSNLLVTDEGIDELVIKSTDACTDFEVNGSEVQVGASMMIPQFIKRCVDNDLGGYEYLYSVPGTVGGGIYMNAGRGRSHDLTISDHLTGVEVFVDGEVRTFEKSELQFEHRRSTFHNHDDWVILSATFDMPEQPAEKGNKLIKDRMSKVGERERGQPNAGSVFKSRSRLPVHKISPNGLSVDGARFVSGNRICHNGNATFDDVYRLVKRAAFLHRIMPPFEKPVIEWEIWE